MPCVCKHTLPLAAALHKLAKTARTPPSCILSRHLHARKNCYACTDISDICIHRPDKKSIEPKRSHLHKTKTSRARALSLLSISLSLALARSRALSLPRALARPRSLCRAAKYSSGALYQTKTCTGASPDWLPSHAPSQGSWASRRGQTPLAPAVPLLKGWLCPP